MPRLESLFPCSLFLMTPADVLMIFSHLFITYDAWVLLKFTGFHAGVNAAVALSLIHI